MNMKDNCKELLIDTTIDIINENNGDVSKVTIREISKRTKVAVGLINYHFKNKDNLITCCVQKIIRNVVTSFKPILNIDNSLDSLTKTKIRLASTAKQVFEFLFSNPSICKISILNDYNEYKSDSNSNMTIKGFMTLMGDLQIEELEKSRIAFYLTNNIQVAFIRSNSESQYLGYDFSSKESRDKYIDDLVNRLF